MKSLARLAFWPLAALPLTAGCGLDENDMRKYAIKRPSDDELENARPAAVAAATTNVPPANVPATSGVAPVAAPAAERPPVNPVETPVASVATPANIVTSGPAGTAVPGETAADVSDTRSPDPSLTVTQRRQITIDNMTRIVQALEAYRANTRTYPAFAIHSNSGQPLLSWRVELLPYLGYHALYNQFRHTEPWNSVHNQTLMARIPAVYQSPDRFDINTNYLVPVGGTAAFGSPTGSHPRRWDDGLENIVLLLEVDDAAAVPWTAPRDWSFDPRTPARSLGNLRDDGFLAGWGGGTLALVPRGTAVADLRAMFTVDGGESFLATSICQAAMAEPAISSRVEPTVPHALDARALVTEGSARPFVRQEERFDVRPSTMSASGNMAEPWAALSQRALAAGLNAQATQLAAAAFLVDEPFATMTYRWIPALRRPVSDLRFGIGLDYSGPNVESIRRQLSPQDDQRGQPPSQLVTLVGDLAQPVFDQLQNGPWRTRSVDERSGDPRRSVKEPPVPLPMLGVATARKIVRAAQLADIDVVLMFEVEDKTTRGGVQSKAVQLSVWDSWSSREVFKVQQVNYLRREQSKSDPLYRDPIDVAAGAFATFVREQLRPEPLPNSLGSEQAARRINQLAGFKRDNPLLLLSEMKFYRDCGLVSVEQLMAAYQAVLGAQAGAELLAGSAEEKRAAIARWIPDIQTQLAKVARHTPPDDDD